MGNSLVTLFLAFPFLILLAGAFEASAQTYATWTHSRHILFNTTASGANVSGSVTGFPVLVRLTAANFDFGEALAGGADIRFEDPDGTPLAYQIEAWDGAGQTADIWVKVPQVDGNSSQDHIRMFWGKAGATNESSGPDVFPGGGGFGGVWHLNEDGNTAAGGYLNATGAASHGTGTGMNAATDIPAIAARGQVFDGTSQFVDFGSAGALHGSTALTLEAWFHRTSSPASDKAILSRPYSTNAAPYHEYLVSINPAGTLSFSLTTAGAQTVLNASTPAGLSTWHHVAAVYDGGAMRIYLDGVLAGSTAKTGSITDYAQAVKLAAYTFDNAMRFNGTLDEPRVSTVARSADWIKLGFANQKPSQNLVNLGPRIWDGGGSDDSWNNPLNWNGDVVPSPDEEVLFDGAFDDAASLTASVAVKSLILTAGYTGVFSFANHSLTVLAGPADFRSGGSIAAGSGSLVLASTGSMNLHPHASSTLPGMVANGPGTVAVNSNLQAASLTVSAGTLVSGAYGISTAGNVLVNGGTLDATSGSLDVGGDITITSGTLNLPSGTADLDGNLTHSGGTLAHNAGTLRLSGATTGKNLTLPSTLNNLVVNGSGGAWTLGSNLSANSLTLTAGTLDVSTRTLTLSGNFTATGGTFTAGSGTLDFDGSYSQTGGTVTAPSANPFTVRGGFACHTSCVFQPNGGTVTLDAYLSGQSINSGTPFHNLTFNGTGGWTGDAWIQAAGTLTLASGTLNTSSVEVDVSAGNYTLTGGTHTATASNVFVSGNFSQSGGTFTAPGGSGKELYVGGDFSQGAGTFTPGSGTLFLNGTATGKTLTAAVAFHKVTVNGSGGAWTLGTALNTSGALTVSAGTLDASTYTIQVASLAIDGGALEAMGSALYVNGDFSMSGGSLSMPSGDFTISGNVSRTAGTATHNSGWMKLIGSGAGKTFDFSPTLHNLNVSGSGGSWTVSGSPITAVGLFQVQTGAINLGTSLTHSVGTFNSMGGDLDFSSSTMEVSGNTAYFSSLTSLSAGSGTLEFTDPSGIQMVHGFPGDDNPHIVHSGAGTLRLGTTPLTCLSFSQTDGTLDLNGYNFTTASGGDFSITNGDASSLANLGGRTLRVLGDAVLAGAASGSRLNLDAGAAWYLNVSGTATVSLATVQNANSGGYSSVACSNCANLGNNGNWTFAMAWDGGGGGDAAWTNPANWGADAVPTSSDDVIFNATNLGVVLDADTSVKSLTMTSGYTGSLDFGSSTLTVYGNADFRSGGGIIANTGSLAFAGSGTHTFIPKTGATFPAIHHDRNAGTTTLTTHPLTAGILTLGMGTFNLGAGLTHTLGGIAGAGGLDFGTSNLYVTGDVDLGSQTVNATSASTLAFTGTSAQTFIPNPSAAMLNLSQNGSGGTTLAGSATTPTLTIASGTFNLGTGRALTVNTALTLTGGGLEFGSSSLYLNVPTADFRNLSTLTPGTGVILLQSNSAITFIPKANAAHPTLNKYGTGTLTFSLNALNAEALLIYNGTVDLGSGFTHALGSLACPSVGGTLTFNNSTLRITSGNAGFGGLTTLNPGTGILEFTAASGTQYHGGFSGTEMAIVHSGAAALALSGPITTLSFTQSAGTLDFNGYDLTTVSGGNLTVVNGHATSFAGLEGRTVMVNGNASLAGASSSNRLNLDPASGWTLAVTGTLTASLATVKNGTASGSSRVCTNCANAGGNSNWTFATSWDGGGGNSSWTTAANWGSDVVPTSTDHVTFNAGSFDATLDADTTVKSITFTSGYTGTFSFSSHTLTVDGGGADFRSGGAITAGTGTLAFAGGGSQTFIPKSGATFPAIHHNSNAGTTTLTTNPLTAGVLTLGMGTFNLGAGLTHTLGGIAGAGGLDFGTSNLNVSGDVDLGSQTVTATSASTLAFTGASAQTYIPKSSEPDLHLAQNGSGGTTVMAYDITAPSLAITAGNFNLGAGRSHTVGAFSASGGGLDFGSSLLSLTGTAQDFSGLGTLTASAGTLAFNGSSAQTFTPKATHTYPTLVQNGSGGTTLAAQDLNAGALSIANGTLDLGSSRTHSIASLAASAGGLVFNNSTLKVTAGHAVFTDLETLNAGTGTLELSQPSGQQDIGPKSGATHPHVRKTGAATTNIGGMTLGNLEVGAGSVAAGGTLILQGNLSVTGGALDAQAASLDVNGDVSVSASQLLKFPAGGGGRFFNVSGSFTAAPTAQLWPNSGTLTLDGTAAGKTLDIGPSIDNLVVNGLGGEWAALNRGISMNGNLSLAAGTFKLAAYTSLVNSVASSGGALDFGSGTLRVWGNGDFSGLDTLVAGTGTLDFYGSSGTQVFTPRSGTTHPVVTHTTGTTLQLSGTSLDARGFTQTAGNLSLNGYDLILSDSGNLAVSGSALPILDLANRTLTVTGNAHFAGTPATKADLNPTSPWILDVSGSLTAVNANLRNSAATGTAGIADSSVDQGGNSSWTFVDSIKPDNVSGFLASALSGNGIALAWTATASDDADSVMLRYRTDGSYPASRTDGSLWRSVTSDRVADTATGLPDKTVYHFAAFVKDSAGNYSLAATAARDSARLPDTTRPDNVAGFLASALSGNAVALAWTGSASEDADSVMLRYRADGTYPANQADGSLWRVVRADRVADTVAGLADKASYHFAAFVKDTTGNYSLATSASRDSARLPDTTRPASVSGFLATATSGSGVALTWTSSDSADADSVMLRYRTDGSYPSSHSDGALWRSVAAGKVADTAMGLPDKTIYHFSAFVKDSSGNFSLGNTAARDSARLPDTTRPDNVTAFLASAIAGNGVALAWTASLSGDADSVMLRYRADGTYPADRNDGTLWRSLRTDRVADTVFGLPEKKVYHFAAFVKDSAGNYSPATSASRDSALVPDTTRPADVTGFLATTLAGNAVALDWTPTSSGDAASTVLRYRTDGTYPANGTDGTLWRAVPADLTADTATGLAEKTVYHFAAFVKDSSGNHSLGTPASRDSARLPDITPPDNVTALVASGVSASTAALAWTPSGTPDADSVMIRYRTGLTPPSGPADGALWRMLPRAADRDTLGGLATNLIYAFSLFVRDSSGLYSPAAAAAQDTSLYQVPVIGTVSVADASGLTRDVDPALAFTWSGADSVRFALLPDTGAAAWKPVLAADSLSLGPDGHKVVAAQFKNLYGGRSPWYRDTTLLDRQAPTATLDLKPELGRWTWPVAVTGKSRDSLSGTDMVFVVRRRLADGFHFNGAAWQAAADTAKLVLSGGDSLFSASLPAAAMATGDYEFTAYSRDRAGNVGQPATQAVRYEDNRAPALAYSNFQDTVAQNRAVAWKLDFGDLDAGDSLALVSLDAPAWLAAAPGPDTAWAPWTLHETYALSGHPGQAEVGSHVIRFRMQDRGGLILTLTDTLHVADVNDTPAWNDSESVYSAKEDETTEWIPRFEDLDPDDQHSLALLSGPGFAHVEGLSVILKPGSRDVGEFAMTLVVSDGELADTLATALTVVNVNDKPYAFASAGFPSPAFFREDRPDSFSVVVVDLDRHEPVVLAGQLPPWMKSSMAIDSTGYNRTFTFRIHPSQADTGLVSLSLTFMDAAQAVAQLSLSGRILPNNDTPTAVVEDPRTHGGAARFKLSVRDEDGSLEQARFHYRLVRLVGPAGDTVRRGITPASQLSLHPLADGEYRLAVRAEDQDGVLQGAFTVVPFGISGATTLSLDTARWHMLGPQQALLPAAAFGAGATLASWDEAGDDGQPLARYASGKTVEALKRGKGYWVRLAEPVTLATAQKDLAVGPAAMKLTRAKQGWNQVANPFPYWVDLSASRLTFWEWDAEKRDLVNARGLLKPWAAYWVLAPKDTALQIADAPYFPAPQGVLAKSAVAGAMGAAEGSGFKHRGDWSLQLGLKAGRYHDEANRLGVRAGPAAASDGPRVLADAPKFGDFVALHFENPAAKETADQGFAQDFREALDPEEEWWDFSVENRGTGETQALLSTAGLEGLASAGLKLFVVKRGEARLIEPGRTATLAVEGEKTHYSLVVTPHADFAGRLKGNFSISQNFPNPVTTFTAFRFVLPQSWDREGKRVARDFKLRIKVYDYSGREVARPVDGSFRPGSHVLRWTPATISGRPLAKGAYVYRLETTGFVKSLKMVVK